MGETIRRAVEGLEIVHADGTRIPITVSVGVSAIRPGSGDGAALIEAADLALYAAKRAGRNVVRVGTPPGSVPPVASRQGGEQAPGAGWIVDGE
jgi:diguanylate cyclase (GGDEF)-like protein